jgi:hypothetical protein
MMHATYPHHFGKGVIITAELRLDATRVECCRDYTLVAISSSYLSCKYDIALFTPEFRKGINTMQADLPVYFGHREPRRSSVS